jgi:hypothetical protein
MIEMLKIWVNIFDKILESDLNQRDIRSSCIDVNSETRSVYSFYEFVN